jgi:hypothetical protein
MHLYWGGKQSVKQAVFLGEGSADVLRGVELVACNLYLLLHMILMSELRIPAVFKLFV